MKQLKITVNGKTYDVAVEEVGTGAAPVASAPVVAAAPAPAPVAVSAPAPAAAPAEAAPAPAAAGTAGSVSVTAPMPGNINDIRVSVGQQVKKGDTMVVLEAMKMENDIPAPADGVVASINVNKGDTVDSGAVIATLN